MPPSKRLNSGFRECVGTGVPVADCHGVRKEAAQSNSGKILAGVLGGTGVALGVGTLGVAAYDSGQATDGVKAQWVGAMAGRQNAYLNTINGIQNNNLTSLNASMAVSKHLCATGYYDQDANCRPQGGPAAASALRGIAEQDQSIPGVPFSNATSRTEPGSIGGKGLIW